MTERLPALVEAVLRLEGEEDLDELVDRMEPFARSLVADDRLRKLLQGDHLGHAVHPVLSDLPYGAWLSATVLDAFGGQGAREAARRLIGVGLLGALPTVLTGWAEWADADRRVQRVGIPHAGANTIAVVVYGASWFARRRGHHRLGGLLGLTGMIAVGVGGFLGGHMATARGHGSRHEAFADG